jgi:DNA-binding transcriptional MerR regulator
MTDSEGRFDDGKAAAALRTIGEVSKALGIRQHVLRYWEEQFPMLKPLKRSGGRRYYRPEDVSVVESIDRLVHREGYTLKGARKALARKSGDAQPMRAVADVAEAPVAASEAVLHRLTAIRNELAAALAA